MSDKKQGFYLYERQALVVLNAETVPKIWLKLSRIVDPYLGGRFREQGPCSGEAFRDDVLIPLLKMLGNGIIAINLEDIMGPTPSFFEEAFGGLVRKLGPEVLDRIHLETLKNLHLAQQISDYMDEAAGVKNG